MVDPTKAQQERVTVRSTFEISGRLIGLDAPTYLVPDRRFQRSEVIGQPRADLQEAVVDRPQFARDLPPGRLPRGPRERGHAIRHSKFPNIG